MTKTSYDPNRVPDPNVWRDMDDVAGERLVARYHRSPDCDHPPGPNPRVHDMIHLIVERQAALEAQTPVAATIARLVGEGLSRHDAVHAVGAVLARLIYETSAGGVSAPENATALYFTELQGVTAQSWLSSSDEERYGHEGGCGCDCDGGCESEMDCGGDCDCGDDCGCDAECGCEDCDCDGEQDAEAECICYRIEEGSEELCPVCDAELLDDDLSETGESVAVDFPASKVGRNDPCPCGSGRKYKKCCLAKDPGIGGAAL